MKHRLTFAVEKLLRMALLLLGVSLVTFLLMCASPLDPLQTNVGQTALGSMSPEQVELFNHFDYQKEKIETSIGVRNVITRLKLYYGGQGSFYVESWKETDREGTRITMKIPYEA